METRGQASVEVIMSVIFIVAALLALSIYIQRGYQGYLYAQSQAQGQQFDPNSAYTDTRRLNSFAVQQTMDQALVTPDSSIFGGYCDEVNPANGCWPDLSGGKAYGHWIQSKSQATSSWDIGRNANYTAN